MYSKELMELYNNSMYRGELQNPTLKIDATSQSCGDHLIFTLIVKNDFIIEIRHAGQGSVLGYIVAALLCKQVIGKTINEALQINAVVLLKELNIELGLTRLRTLNFIVDTFHKGLLDYAQS